MNKYTFGSFKGDVVGGIVSAIIAIPLALAFGVASGLGPTAGLYSSIILCIAGLLFGMAPAQISGPTGPVTIVVASAIAFFHNAPENIFAVIILAGIFQLIIAISRVAEVIKFVPYPVISGFMSGIGAILIILQINPLLGLNVHPTPLQTLLHLNHTIAHYSQQDLILGLLSLAIVLITPPIVNKLIPSYLIALIVGTFVSIKYGFDVETIGYISTSMPNFVVPFFDLESISRLLPLAFTLAVVASMESLLTTLVINSLNKSDIQPNKVILGQGAGNIFAGLCGGLMGAGAAMRTVANMKSGGATKFSTFVHALVIVLLIAKGDFLLSSIPLAVLAGILIKVGIDIIDFKLLKIIGFAHKHDLYVLLIVFILTVFYDLIFAVGVGITLSAVLFAKRAADTTSIGIKEIYDKDIAKIESQIEKDSQHKIRVVHIAGPFFFGTASQIISHFDDVLGTKYLILNYESDAELDISALLALQDIIIRLQSQRIRVLLVVKSKEVETQLKDLKILRQIGPKHVFYDEIEAINLAKEYLKRNIPKMKKK